MVSTARVAHLLGTQIRPADLASWPQRATISAMHMGKAYWVPQAEETLSAEICVLVAVYPLYAMAGQVMKKHTDSSWLPFLYLLYPPPGV